MVVDRYPLLAQCRPSLQLLQSAAGAEILGQGLAVAEQQQRADNADLQLVEDPVGRLGRALKDVQAAAGSEGLSVQPRQVV